MSSLEAIGGTRNRSVKVEKFRSFAKVSVFEEDGEKAQINDECGAGCEKIQHVTVKPDFVVVASNDEAATQAAAAPASADVDARREQLVEEFEIEKKLIIDQLQREEMITANYHNLDHLHLKDLSCLEREHESLDVNVDNRSKEFPSPNVEKVIAPQRESSIPSEEVSEEPHCDGMSQSAILAQASENVNELRSISAESELDRLSRQVQVLVHQLAGCRQNLLRAEIEVGVLHEENRELRCLVKDLLAAYSRS